jgi:hypothetical protein
MSPPVALRVEYRIGIQATAERIWEVFANLERWPDWNPAYPEAKGDFAFGGTLQLLERVPGAPERWITGGIVDWTPYAQVVLRVDDGFLAHRLQYFEIDRLADVGCIFAAGAFFNGFNAPGLMRKTGRGLKLGFGLMAEALKAKVEES